MENKGANNQIEIGEVLAGKILAIDLGQPEMRRLFLFLILIPLNVNAQKDSVFVKYHRFYLNPVNLLLGDYAICYSWKISGRVSIEPSLGYLNVPHQPGMIDKTDPSYGLGYYGPYVRIGLKVYNHRKRKSFVSFDVAYKIQQRDVICYVDKGHNTISKSSAEREGIALRMLFGKTIPIRLSRFCFEPYAGVGIKTFWGTETDYLPFTYGEICMDPNRIETTENHPINFAFQSINLGFRIGWQFEKPNKVLQK